jgi:hypothetical protein
MLAALIIVIARWMVGVRPSFGAATPTGGRYVFDIRKLNSKDEKRGDPHADGGSRIHYSCFALVLLNGLERLSRLRQGVAIPMLTLTRRTAVVRCYQRLERLRQHVTL